MRLPKALRDAFARYGRIGGKVGGKIGGAKGGRARAAKLTPERRQEIARKAAKARWAHKRAKKKAPTPR
jgi:hypothetical protein